MVLAGIVNKAVEQNQLDISFNFLHTVEGSRTDNNGQKLYCHYPLDWHFYPSLKQPKF